MNVNKPVLLIGAPGVTKSSTAQQYLQTLSSDTVTVKAVPFSFATSPNLFQRTIEGAVEKRQGLPALRSPLPCLLIPAAFHPFVPFRTNIWAARRQASRDLHRRYQHAAN